MACAFSFIRSTYASILPLIVNAAAFVASAPDGKAMPYRISCTVGVSPTLKPAKEAFCYKACNHILCDCNLLI